MLSIYQCMLSAVLQQKENNYNFVQSVKVLSLLLNWYRTRLIGTELLNFNFLIHIQGRSYVRHVPIHKFDIFFYKSMLHFPTGICMQKCSMILWMRLSVGKSGGFLYMINQRLYSTLYIQQTVTYTRLYRVCHQYLTDNARVVGNK